MLAAADSAAAFPSWTFGAFMLGASIAMAVQTLLTARRGYMFCGCAEVVHKNVDPRRFRFWLRIQIIFVLTLLSFSIWSFWRMGNHRNGLEIPSVPRSG
jgi:hypothetical protein